MKYFSVAEARGNFSQVLDASEHEAVVIKRRGKRAAVVISPEQYELMHEALENAEDVAAFDAAMSEDDENIPWEQVKADLGWE